MAVAPAAPPAGGTAPPAGGVGVGTGGPDELLDFLAFLLTRANAISAMPMMTTTSPTTPDVPEAMVINLSVTYTLTNIPAIIPRIARKPFGFLFIFYGVGGCGCGPPAGG